MLTKSWHLHVKNITEEGELPLICQLLNRPSKRRTRFFSSGRNLPGTQQDLLYSRLFVELQWLTKGIKKESKIMDGFDDAKKIDSAISILRNIVSEWDGYRDIFNEANSTDKKLLASFPLAGRERDLMKLGLILIEAAKYNHHQILEAYIDNHFPMNFQHPLTDRTALHEACTFQSNDFIRILLDKEKCDLLLRSQSGDLAYDVAYESMENLELAYQLRDDTIAQANLKGINSDQLFKNQKDDYWETPDI